MFLRRCLVGLVSFIVLAMVYRRGEINAMVRANHMVRQWRSTTTTVTTVPELADHVAYVQMDTGIWMCIPPESGAAHCPAELPWEKDR